MLVRNMNYQIFYVPVFTIIILQIHVTIAVRRPKQGHMAYPPAPPGTLEPSTEFEDTPCGIRTPIPDLNTDFINQAPAWYIPVAHKYFFRSWAEALLNRSIVASEMSNMCMRWLFLSPTRPRGKYNIIVGGFGQSVTQYCMDTGFETETCEAPRNSPEHHKIADNVGTIVATDNKRWFLLYRCVRNIIKDWAVFFIDRRAHDADAETFKKIADIVKNNGFDLKYVDYGKYDDCPTSS